MNATERLVVMGGSFNPPTVAHLRLMEAAIEASDADGGVFVPTAHDYVARKMKRQESPQDTLGEEVRLAMLATFREGNARLSVSRIQMDREGRAYDFEMLEDVQAEHPHGEILFLVGSDKLHILPRWHRIDELLDRFRVLVARRGEDDLEQIRDASPYLSRRWGRFVAFDVPAEVADVSSSLFRRMLRDGDEAARDLVTPAVWDILDQEGRVPWHSVTDFHEEPYRFLSNFHEARVEFGGLVFGNAEAAFQAQKCTSEEEKAQFTGLGPGKSKGVGRHVRLRPDWEDVKLDVMEGVVRAKFTQNPDLAERLLATGDMVLVEGNRWGDTFWGVDARTGQGQNHLGRILMRVRDELRTDSIQLSGPPDSLRGCSRVQLQI